MNKILLLFCILFLFGAAPPKQPNIVTIVPLDPVKVATGEGIELPLELKILKGFHIQSNPASEKYLIPLTVKLEPVDGIQIGLPIYPPGLLFRLKGSDRDISTYEKSVLIKIPLKVEQSLKSGEIPLKGTIRYQGCDAELCFPPVTIPLEVKLRVQQAG